MLCLHGIAYGYALLLDFSSESVDNVQEYMVTCKEYLS